MNLVSGHDWAFPDLPRAATSYTTLPSFLCSLKVGKCPDMRGHCYSRPNDRVRGGNCRPSLAQRYFPAACGATRPPKQREAVQ
jgi:hypothetical protein